VGWVGIGVWAAAAVLAKGAAELALAWCDGIRRGTHQSTLGRLDSTTCHGHEGPHTMKRQVRFPATTPTESQPLVVLLSPVHSIDRLRCPSRLVLPADCCTLQLGSCLPPFSNLCQDVGVLHLGRHEPLHHTRVDERRSSRVDGLRMAAGTKPGQHPPA
jgi:hypothetical protein